jgi:hypothetical protein
VSNLSLRQGSQQSGDKSLISGIKKGVQNLITLQGSCLNRNVVAEQEVENCRMQEFIGKGL